MAKKLSVFAFRDVTTSTGTQRLISQFTYTRPGEPDFISNSNRFTFNANYGLPSAGIQTNTSICVVNRRGANNRPPLDMLVLTTGNRIAWKTTNVGDNFPIAWDESTISPTLPGGIAIASSPAASAFVDGRLIMVVRGANNQLFRCVYNGTNWQNWVSSPALGAPSGQTLAGDPTVVASREDAGYRVYARTTTNQLWVRIFNGGTSTLGNWTQARNASGVNISTNASPEGVDPAFTSVDPGVAPADPYPLLQLGFSVFYNSLTNSMLLTKFPSGSEPIDTEDFSGGLTSSAGSAYFAGPIAPVFQAPNTGYRELHTFVRGNDGLMYGRYASLSPDTSSSLLTSPNWYALTNIGQIVGRPAAVTWDDGQVS